MASFRLSDLLPARRTNLRGPTAADVAQLADRDGFNLIPTDDGRFVAVPKDVGPGDVTTFANRWGDIVSPENASYTAVNRDHRVKMYEMMDGSGAEGSMILDTYADEALNVTNADNRVISVHVQCSDEKVKQGIADVLRTHQVIENAHSDIRAMVKYGDACYAVRARSEVPYQVSADGVNSALSGNVLPAGKQLRPEDLVLEFLPGKVYELAAFKDRIFKLTKRKEFDNTTAKYDYFAKREHYMPWEFALFSLRSRETFPYGMSILEKMRIPYEQLGALEGLLAITRANHVDRIGVGVPGMGGIADPTTMLAKLSHLKNLFKNVVLGPGGSGAINSRYTRNQDIGLLETIFYPDNFTVKKLSTEHTLAEIADVEYFRDKLYNASRLPKGYFLADKVTDRGYALRQQDIKFARSVLPVARSYVEGLERLCFLIGFYLGANIEDLHVQVRIQQSSYLSLDIIKSYQAAFDLITQYVNVQRLGDPEYRLPEEQLHRMLAKAGIPLDFFEDTALMHATMDRLLADAKLETEALVEEMQQMARVAVGAAPLHPRSLLELCLLN